MANVPRSGWRRLRDSWPDSRRTFNTSNVWPRRRWKGWVTVAEPKKRLVWGAVRWVCADDSGPGGADRRQGKGRRRMSGGKSSARGTPQGGVISPMLSVIYMNRFLKHWRLSGRCEAFRAHDAAAICAMNRRARRDRGPCAAIVNAASEPSRPSCERSTRRQVFSSKVRRRQQRTPV
jgi:hypothetical protein